MPVTKKEGEKKERRPDHKCWWQTKNGCPNQASKQMTPNERKTIRQKLVANEKGLPLSGKQTADTKWKKDQTTKAGGKRKRAALIRQANSWHQMKEIKQLKPPEKRRRWPTCKHKVGKNTTKSQQSNRLLSATNEWTTTYIDYICCSQKRTEITVPTNRWKAKLTITNINLN